MIIDMDRINKLIADFSDLNEENQKHIINEIFILKQKEKLSKEDPSLLEGTNKDERMSKKLNEIFEDVHDIAQLIPQIENEDKAVIIAVMEKLHPGSFTEHKHLKVTIETKKSSLKDVILEHFPEVDAEKAIKEATTNVKLINKQLKNKNP
ncbi:hypothetical protein MKA27_19625 [[Clostridium] innocuum]|uniref:hypothetical protein n=1 Tax=Clostridium innocuum TaxID=1522 RepID=UPI000D6D0DB7|nr:hypothetical protein [[Clostridium] innocuum]MCR0316601.1 hypothetical protein [[Clostridium] innocuum]MCR0376000.1 hypothetical protein [[Clostridium] innocuum]MCR0561251.1 hypothetical protein [[Clostridium] innocuum]MCR0604543.1 hypothetical protein [[Clostridium] innocuum]PWJ10175.1 hypothetical protein ATF84_12337 [[Clostridium] innocuum]